MSALEIRDRPLLAGLRPSMPAAATSVQRLDLRLLGDFQSIVDLAKGVHRLAASAAHALVA